MQVNDDRHVGVKKDDTVGINTIVDANKLWRLRLVTSIHEGTLPCLRAVDHLGHAPRVSRYMVKQRPKYPTFLDGASSICHNLWMCVRYGYFAQLYLPREQLLWVGFIF